MADMKAKAAMLQTRPAAPQGASVQADKVTSAKPPISPEY